MARNLMSLFIWIISLYNTIHFLPFCTPHHQRTWWFRWELCIITRSYWQLTTSVSTYTVSRLSVTPVHSSLFTRHYKPIKGLTTKSSHINGVSPSRLMCPWWQEKWLCTAIWEPVIVYGYRRSSIFTVIYSGPVVSGNTILHQIQQQPLLPLCMMLLLCRHRPVAIVDDVTAMSPQPSRHCGWCCCHVATAQSPLWMMLLLCRHSPVAIVDDVTAISPQPSRHCGWSYCYVSTAQSPLWMILLLCLHSPVAIVDDVAAMSPQPSRHCGWCCCYVATAQSPLWMILLLCLHSTVAIVDDVAAMSPQTSRHSG